MLLGERLETLCRRRGELRGRFRGRLALERDGREFLVGEGLVLLVEGEQVRDRWGRRGRGCYGRFG